LLDHKASEDSALALDAGFGSKREVAVASISGPLRSGIRKLELIADAVGTP
jgi:hypothetical protein